MLNRSGELGSSLVVLGGLVPEVLTRDQDPPVPQHLGTTDVDVLINFQVDMEQDLGNIEKGLKELGFTPDRGANGWRWIGDISGFPVRLEFLCELDNQPAGAIVRPVGCNLLGAANLRGVGFVAFDHEVQTITGELQDGTLATIRVPFAGLCGYLLAKAMAVTERGKEKDYYDLVYVLLYNRRGGPGAVATALKESQFAGRLNTLASTWRELGARFQTAETIGPRSYSAQAYLANPTADRLILRQDAVAAVTEFLMEINT